MTTFGICGPVGLFRAVSAIHSRLRLQKATDINSAPHYRSIAHWLGSSKMCAARELETTCRRKSERGLRKKHHSLRERQGAKEKSMGVQEKTMAPKKK
jgi:hypothetical protein